MHVRISGILRFLPLLAVTVFLQCSYTPAEYDISGMVTGSNNLQALGGVTVRWIEDFGYDPGDIGTRYKWDGSGVSGDDGVYSGVLKSQRAAGCTEIDITSPDSYDSYFFRFSKEGYYTLDVRFESRWFEKVGNDNESLRVPSVRLVPLPQ